MNLVQLDLSSKAKSYGWFNENNFDNAVSAKTGD